MKPCKLILLPQRKQPGLRPYSEFQFQGPFGLLRLHPLPGSEALTKVPARTKETIRALNTGIGITRALYEEAAGFEPSIKQIALLDPLSPQLPLTIIWHGIPAEHLKLEPLAEASMRDLAKRSQSGRFIIAENSGHYVTFDRPDVVVEALTAMIESVKSRSEINRKVPDRRRDLHPGRNILDAAGHPIEVFTKRALEHGTEQTKRKDELAVCSTFQVPAWLLNDLMNSFYR